VGKISHHYLPPVDWVGIFPTYSLRDNNTILIGLTTNHFLLYSLQPSFVQGIFLTVATESTKQIDEST
jgi:hypothetical protein